MVHTVKTTRGRVKIVDDSNYVYRRDNCKGEKTYWICEIKECKARVHTLVTNDQITICKRNGSHCHPCQPVKPKVYQAIANLKSLAINSDMSAKALIAEISSNLDNSTSYLMPSVQYLTRTISNWRRKKKDESCITEGGCEYTIADEYAFLGNDIKCERTNSSEGCDYEVLRRDQELMDIIKISQNGDSQSNVNGHSTEEWIDADDDEIVANSTDQENIAAPFKLEECDADNRDKKLSWATAEKSIQMIIEFLETRHCFSHQDVMHAHMLQSILITKKLQNYKQDETNIRHIDPNEISMPIKHYSDDTEMSVKREEDSVNPHDEVIVKIEEKFDPHDEVIAKIEEDFDPNFIDCD